MYRLKREFTKLYIPFCSKFCADSENKVNFGRLLKIATLIIAN
jgi:hypothetical protein